MEGEEEEEEEGERAGRREREEKRNRKKRDGKWGEKEEGDEFYCSCVMEKDTGIFSRSQTLSHSHSLFLSLSLFNIFSPSHTFHLISFHPEPEVTNPLLLSPPSLLLSLVCQYLRSSHFFCLYCGTKYASKEEMEELCPGEGEEEHE